MKVEPEFGQAVRRVGRQGSFIFTGEKAPTPEGKAQAYWFVDEKDLKHHAFTLDQVRLPKGRKKR